MQDKPTGGDDMKKERWSQIRIANAAFENAIETGRLSADPKAANYAGDFMWMGTQNGRDLFKDTATREYLA
jgi:hypothetical protein